MAATHPLDLAVRLLVEKLEFISRHKADVVFIGEYEIGHFLLMNVEVEADLDASLGLGLLKALIIVCFEFDQRLEDILILLWVSIPKEYWRHRLLLLLLSCANITNLGLRLLFPELF
jgi:hypothetical protein